MDSFVLVAYASLAASKTLLQQLLACLNFILDSKIYSVDANEESDSYELWQQHKQLKTMKMSEVWLDTYDEGYTHQFQPESFRQFQIWTQSVVAAEASSLKISSHITSLKWSQRPSQSAWE